jgi:malate/lactate dehydrogenase
MNISKNYFLNLCYSQTNFIVYVISNPADNNT